MRRRPVAKPCQIWPLAIRGSFLWLDVEMEEVLGATLTDLRARPGERGPWEVVVAPAALGMPRAW